MEFSEKGNIYKDRFVTYRNGKKHFFRIFNGFGISEDVLSSLPNNIKWVVFYYKGVKGKEIYRIKKKNVIDKATVWFDGSDKQYILNKKDMEFITEDMLDS